MNHNLIKKILEKVDYIKWKERMKEVNEEYKEKYKFNKKGNLRYIREGYCDKCKKVYFPKVEREFNHREILEWRKYKKYNCVDVIRSIKKIYCEYEDCCSWEDVCEIYPLLPNAYI